MSAVDAMKELYAAIGARLFPLKSVDDALDLMEAAVAVPEHLPSRGDRIRQRLANLGSRLGASAASTLEQLAATVGATETAARIMKVQPPANGLVLMTERERCVVQACGGELVVASRSASIHSCHPQLYTKTGVVEGVELVLKRCTKCNALHYLSYASPPAASLVTRVRPAPASNIGSPLPL